ncbi:MAG: cupin domain-containing protein [Actinobacteria bacterium]|nr:cupin domain-containing protein [Actinomycetota bacterium]
MSVSADAQIVHDPVFRHRLRFTETTDERGAPAVLCEMWVDPGGGVPPHVHPRMEERFTVMEGRMEFLAGRRWSGADAGATVVVPPGTRHAYRNSGDTVAYTRCIATPPDPALEGFLTDAAVLSRNGRITRRGIPKGVTGWLQGAVMLDTYGEMVEMSFPPAPPRALQRLLMPPLARLAKRRGIRAGQFD